MIRSVTPAALALFALAGRTDERSPVRPGKTAASEIVVSHASTPAKQTTTVASAEDSCGAAQLRGWISAWPTGDVKAQIAHTVGKRTIRYYREGDPITIDFAPARLNAIIGKSGRIADFRCG